MTHVKTAEPTRRSLGLWGCFDVDTLDDQIRVRVGVHELSARRPDLAIRLFAPFGSSRPIAVAADLAVEAIAPVTGARVRALAQELDAVVIVGDPAQHGADWLRTAYAGHPEVDPRDIDAAIALCAAPGECGPVGHDAVAPHPALLARRVWPFGVCEQRREFLRAMHWWPQHGAAVVVSGHDGECDRIDALVAALGDVDVTVLGAAHGDDVFSTRLTERVGPRARHMPASLSSIDDRVAAVAGAHAVISSDPCALALADAFGRPRGAVHAPGSVVSSAPDEFGADEATLDAHYDSLAALVPGDVVPALAAPEVLALRAALDARALRTAHERVVLADYVRAVRNNTAAELAAVRAELARTPVQRLRAIVRRGRRRQ